jgi:hypothetical protein
VVVQLLVEEERLVEVSVVLEVVVWLEQQKVVVRSRRHPE